MCQIVKDSTTVVLPEFTDELELEIVREWPKPPHYDAYVAMDLGAKDLTAVLFAYYDFRANKLIIQDEILMDMRMKEHNLKSLMETIKKKEDTLWYDHLTNEYQKPLVRVSDINYLVTDEIARQSEYQIIFTSAKKDNKEAAIHDLRVLLATKRIIIDPKCTNLLRHLRNVKWSSKINKSEFARSADNGHYDAADACIYLTRAVQFGKNPYPSSFDYNMQDLYIPNRKKFNERNNPYNYQKKPNDLNGVKAFYAMLNIKPTKKGP
jgi:hypothetical protein